MESRSLRTLLTMFSAARLLTAENGPPLGDPFAGYHQAIESHLSAILEHGRAQPGNGRKLAPAERKEGDWQRALFSHNAGQNTVEDALTKGGASTFWQLSSAGLLPVAGLHASGNGGRWDSLGR